MVLFPTDVSAKKKDKKSPYVISGVTRDSDGDGRIDGILLTYSEKVKIAKVKKGKKPKKSQIKKFAAWAIRGRSLGDAKLMPGGKSVLIALKESSTPDSADRPTISYLRAPKGLKGVVDKAGNQALTAAIKAKDGVAPKLVTARTADANGNGQVDRIQLTYSEAIAKADATKITVTGHVVASAAASGVNVDVTVDERGVDTDSTPVVSVPAGAVKDGGDNATAGGDTVTSADGAAPVVVDALTGDQDANGRLDKMTLTFSENVTHAVEIGSGSLAVTGFTTVSVSAASGRTIVVSFAETASYNTNAKPSVGATGAGSPPTDASGNVVGSTVFSAARDGAAPALVAARTRDTTSNGRVDAITTTFSEPVTLSGTGTAFTSTAGAGVLGTLTATVTGTGSTVTATVTEIGTGYNTDLPRTSPSVPVPVTYSPSGSISVIDADGNVSPSGVTVNATDGAGPTVVYAETADVDTDGSIDEMLIGFSEPISTLAGAPIQVASGLRPVTATAKITGASTSSPLYGGVRVTLTEQSIFDSADQPTVDYVGSSSDRATDASGNEVPSTGQQAFTGTLDKAPPLLVAAVTRDGNPTNGLVDSLRTTWSEPVSTDGTPIVALSAVNEPTGYTEPVPTTGATASGYTVDVPLTPGSAPDRDIYMLTRYTGSGNADGVTDQASPPNNAAATPGLGFNSSSICTDVSELSSSTQDDTSGAADAASLTSVIPPASVHQATLCGADHDVYSFTATSGQTQKVIFAPAPEVFAMTGRNSSWTPFTVSGPGSPSVTFSFTSAVGWVGTFTPGSTGTFTVDVSDTNSPIADYGYCITRTNDGTTPVCTLRQGDLIITEVLKSIPAGTGAIGPYVEVKNVSGLPVTSADISTLKLKIGAATCNVTPHSGTAASVASGGFFYISTVASGTATNDYDCSGMATPDWAQPMSITTDNGDIDSVNFSTATSAIPAGYSVQLRPQSAFQTSTGNDNLVGGWCISSDIVGSPGAANVDCDDFYVNEVMFMPTSADRDGDVYVEIKGNAPLTAESTLLADWRIRVKPKAMSGKFYKLPTTSNPNDKGIFVLADSPAVSGDTEVPFYSVQSSDVLTAPATDGRDLDQLLRSDTPVSVELLKPDASPYTCGFAALSVLGYIPTPTGTLGVGDSDGVCGAAYEGSPFKPVQGFQNDDTAQRTVSGPWNDDNSADFCARSPLTPMANNHDCVSQT